LCRALGHGTVAAAQRADNDRAASRSA